MSLVGPETRTKLTHRAFLDHPKGWIQSDFSQLPVYFFSFLKERCYFHLLSFLIDSDAERFLTWNMGNRFQTDHNVMELTEAA
jgi:hypothetical protein